MGKNLTKEQQVMIAAIGFAVLIVWVYFKYLLNPTLAQIKTKSDKYNELVSQVEQAERQARQLPVLTAEFEKLKTELEALEKQLPTDKDIPSILRLLTEQTLEHNVSFISLRPIEPRLEPPFHVIEFEMSVTAGLHSFARFVASLGQQERIFQVDQVKVSMGSQPEGQSEPILNFNFQLKTFAYAG